MFVNAWERLGTLGNAWERLGTLGNAWERLGTLGNAWEGLPRRATCHTADHKRHAGASSDHRLSYNSTHLSCFASICGTGSNHPSPRVCVDCRADMTKAEGARGRGSHRRKAAIRVYPLAIFSAFSPYYISIFLYSLHPRCDISIFLYTHLLRAPLPLFVDNDYYDVYYFHMPTPKKSSVHTARSGTLQTT